MYGKKETVEYLCLNLLWGTKLYKMLRFVLVKSSKGECILVSTDLELDPILIIEAYAHRFKIESMFRELKQQVHVFSYHFWTKAMPKIKKYKKKSDSSELSGVKKEEEKRILKTIEATVLDYLRKNIFRLLYLNRHSGISQLILRLQTPVSGMNANSIPY